MLKSIKNKYLFFFLRVMKDIFNPNKYEIAEELHSQELKEYYFLFDEERMHNQKGGQKSIVFDDDGIPMNPTYIDVSDKKYVYFPITIGQVGLAVFHTYLKCLKENDKKRFLKIADWFMKNYEEDAETGVRWMTHVSLPQYKNPGPWQSAFVQSRGLSVLLRAYQITDDKKYLMLAEKALKPFTIAVKNGGVTSFTKFGPFYEEYTASEPTLVLNGMIFSLCGLYDFVRAVPDNDLAKRLFNEGVKTIEAALPEFDMGYWSKYNLCSAEWYPKIDPATITYQYLHITQLNMLYKLTGKEIFKNYANKFKQQISYKNIIKSYTVKYKALKTLNRL